MNSLAQGHVLLVCDRAVTDPVVATVSGQLGHALVRVRDANEAVAQVAATDFALILVGYAGDPRQLLDTVRRLHVHPRARQTPLVVLGLPAAPPFPVELAYEAGAIDVLHEPLAPAVFKAKARFFIDAFRNVTHQKSAEAALQASEERYRTLFESLDEGVCVVEVLFDGAGEAVDYRFLETNPVFVQLTGLANAVGKTMLSLAPQHERHWADTYGRVALTGEPVRFVNEARALGRWYDVYATRIGAAGDHRVAVVFTDISERLRAEDEQRRLADDLAEADRLKSEFLATLAHELRNPLAPIRSGLQFMRLMPADAVALGRVRDIVDRQLDHLVSLVDDLLDIARITRGQVELKRDWIDLNAVLTAAVEISTPLIEAARHQLDLCLLPEPLTLYGDATRLTQVVSNLLNNAAKYTPRGGALVLAAERDGDHALIAVSDNGAGIPADSLETVFRMFTQIGSSSHRQGGLGIGLSLVRSLVELHGGSVSAASGGPGTGSVFTVRLPIAPPDAPPHAVAPPAVAAGAAAAGLRVLVVDDNRDAAETLAALLGLMGHVAPVANDGHQALRMMPGFRPHAVFLDIGMPGLSGYEVAAAIRRDPQYDGVTLVALTGWGGADDRERSAVAGFDLHLTKPATAAAIEAVLAR